MRSEGGALGVLVVAAVVSGWVWEGAWRERARVASSSVFGWSGKWILVNEGVLEGWSAFQGGVFGLVLAGSVWALRRRRWRGSASAQVVVLVASWVALSAWLWVGWVQVRCEFVLHELWVTALGLEVSGLRVSWWTVERLGWVEGRQILGLSLCAAAAAGIGARLPLSWEGVGAETTWGRWFATSCVWLGIAWWLGRRVATELRVPCGVFGVLYGVLVRSLLSLGRGATVVVRRLGDPAVARTASRAGSEGGWREGVDRGA